MGNELSLFDFKNILNELCVKLGYHWKNIYKKNKNKFVHERLIVTKACIEFFSNNAHKFEQSIA